MDHAARRTAVEQASIHACAHKRHGEGAPQLRAAAAIERTDDAVTQRIHMLIGDLIEESGPSMEGYQLESSP